MNGTGAKLLTVICVSTSSQIAQLYRTVTLIHGLWHHLLVSGGFVYGQITREILCFPAGFLYARAY